MHDEIIEEVWAIKESLAAQSGFDIRRIAEEIRQSETKNEAEGWQHIAAPQSPPPHSAFQQIRFAHG
jgi:hypothetical protein